MKNLQNSSAPTRNETQRDVKWSATTADACRPRVGGGRGIIQFSTMQSQLHTHVQADSVGGGGGRSFSPLQFCMSKAVQLLAQLHGVHWCRSVDTLTAITPPMSLASYDDGFRLSSSYRGEGMLRIPECVLDDFNNLLSRESLKEREKNAIYFVTIHNA